MVSSSFFLVVELVGFVFVVHGPLLVEICSPVVISAAQVVKQVVASCRVLPASIEVMDSSTETVLSGSPVVLFLAVVTSIFAIGVV